VHNGIVTLFRSQQVIDAEDRVFHLKN